MQLPGQHKLFYCFSSHQNVPMAPIVLVLLLLFTPAVALVSLPSLVSAASEQEEGGEVLRLFEMWKS